jgi:hypothetical protein
MIRMAYIEDSEGKLAPAKLRYPFHWNISVTLAETLSSAVNDRK